MTTIADLRTLDLQQIAALTPSERDRLIAEYRALFGAYASAREAQTEERRERRREDSAVRARSIRGLFAMARSKSKTRGVEWSLTIDEYTALRSGTCCHYCQGPLNETGTGLDRLDPQIGYVIGNVVPCCWLCNTVKGTAFRGDEMKRIGKTIAAIKRAWPQAKTERPYRAQPRQIQLF